jgi:DNA-binding HxlR family transcriptional regulator
MATQEGTPTTLSNTDVPIAGNRDLIGEKKFQEILRAAKDTQQFCPVRDVIARLSDKWSILVIYALGGYGTLRFNELKHKIGDISQRMLTVTLRNLELDGIITRKIYAEVPPRVEYQLTELGYSLMHQLAQFATWANTNGQAIYAKRQAQKA